MSWGRGWWEEAALPLSSRVLDGTKRAPARAEERIAGPTVEPNFGALSVPLAAPLGSPPRALLALFLLRTVLNGRKITTKR